MIKIISFAVRNKVETEIHRFLKNVIIELVEFSDWDAQNGRYDKIMRRFQGHQLFFRKRGI